MSVIGVDIGGTKIESARVENHCVVERNKVNFNASGSETEILDELLASIDLCMDSSVAAIGVGVPGVVDVDKGIVYDLVNISSWQRVALKSKLQERYQLPVFINNDANCFVLGEKFYGSAKKFRDIVGLSLGTGLGVGLVVNDQLYAGINCGAGELGQVHYLQSDYEAYCSGRFFQKFYGVSGELLYQQAVNGSPVARAAFKEFGQHIGHAIASILLAYDPEYIVIGGSIAKAYPLFSESIFTVLEDFPYPSVIDRLNIGQSIDADMAVLGAASLCGQTDSGHLSWQARA